MITDKQIDDLVDEWTFEVEKYTWGWSPAYKGATDDLKEKLRALSNIHCSCDIKEKT